MQKSFYGVAASLTVLWPTRSGDALRAVLFFFHRFQCAFDCVKPYESRPPVWLRAR